MASEAAGAEGERESEDGLGQEWVNGLSIIGDGSSGRVYGPIVIGQWRLYVGLLEGFCCIRPEFEGRVSLEHKGSSSIEDVLVLRSTRPFCCEDVKFHEECISYLFPYPNQSSSYVVPAKCIEKKKILWASSYFRIPNKVWCWTAVGPIQWSKLCSEAATLSCFVESRKGEEDTAVTPLTEKEGEAQRSPVAERSW
ncbi:hypothetical protein PIB30_071708 [Stylosanthes scabra]|uniref:Uncharacterized protein n=1 Tax=Stylosanthes scabra TaxID=79078 RepID=A0ABU6WRY6_9FABA|nr:hypothetical protein [Stylosanthes scabra]